nr:immunoglobulin heavy chain junction region [Macaca mulatta]MOV49862.1 immunoglobulin heavy chain junction region [Macaca mulatta]
CARDGHDYGNVPGNRFDVW